MNIWAKLEFFPPAVCRLLARTVSSGKSVVRPKTAEEIAQDSGLPVTEVQSLSWKTSWDDVPVTKVKAFSLGCGVDFSNPKSMHRQTVYLSSSPSWSYLKKSDDWHSLYKPLILALQDA